MTRKVPVVTTRRLTRDIRVKINEEIKDKITAEHVDVLNRIDSTRAMAADAAGQYRKTVKELEEQEKHLRVTLEQGEMEEHEVDEIRNTKKNTLTIKRVDTGEIVEEREMTEDDNQLEIDEDAEDGGEEADGTKGDDKDKEGPFED